MAASDVGIVVGDFTNNPLADFGVTATHSVATKTQNPITGAETLSYATGVSITAVFVKRTQRYEQAHEGLQELGDAFMMTALGTDIKKDDKITYNGDVFIVIDTIQRDANGTSMFDSSNLRQVSETAKLPLTLPFTI